MFTQHSKLKGFETEHSNRLEAYRLYLNGDANGKPLSLGQIASLLHVTLGNTRRWKKYDNWDLRVQKAQIRADEARFQKLNPASIDLVAGVRGVMTEMFKLALSHDDPEIRMKASEKYIDCCVSVKKLYPDMFGLPDGGGKPVTFDDKLPEEDSHGNRRHPVGTDQPVLGDDPVAGHPAEVGHPDPDPPAVVVLTAATPTGDGGNGGGQPVRQPAARGLTGPW